MIIKNTISLSLIVFISMIFAIYIAQAGEVKLTTYYPAPYGEYDVISIPETTSSSKGVIKSGTNYFIHTYGSGSTFVGENAGNMTLTGSNNTGIGVSALKKNTSGVNNTAVGVSPLAQNTTGNGNTAIGSLALSQNSTGTFNTAVGSASLYINTTGTGNTAIGDDSLARNTTGGGNCAMGYISLFTNTTGYSNVAMGYNSLFSNTTGANNVAIGSGALNSSTTASLNVAVGTNALYRNTTGMSNTAVGTASLNSNTTGSGNTAVGDDALELNTSGASNVAMGLDALYSNTAGSLNTAIGYNAGRTNSTGNGNVFLGHQAGYSETGSNKLYIANSNVGSPLIYGDFSTARVGIGTTSPAAKLDVVGDGAAIIVPRKSTANDPVGVNGMIYYNNSSNKFRVFENGVWKNLVSGGEFGDWVDMSAAAAGGATQGPAATDGFVLAYTYSNVGGSYDIYGYTDANNPPTACVIRDICGAVYKTAPSQHITMPVKKGHYWRVAGTVQIVFWLPVN